MILAIGMETILESRYYLEGSYDPVENMADRVEYYLSGDGIIFSRILNRQNIEVFTTGFLGGLGGDYIFKELKKLGIYNDFVRIKDETRRDVLLFDDRRLVSKIMEPGPRITRDDIVNFYELFSKVIDRFDIVCGLGPLPIGMPEEIYSDLIHISNKKGKKFILDAKGKELSYGLEAVPFIVNLNKKELENLTRIKINFLNEAIRLGRAIVESGVELVIIDLEEKGSLVLTKEKGYRIEHSQLETQDLGEDRGYTSAGYAFGIEKGYDLETTMRLGQSFRLAYGLGDLDIVDMRDIKRIMTGVEISPIYY